MSRFIFEMPDDMVAAIEAYRQRRGHKATAVSVRELICIGLAAENTKGTVLPPRSPKPTAELAEDAGRLRAAHLEKLTAKPAPERKVVSRLKGEWKAP